MFKLEEGWLTVLLLCAMGVVAAGGVAAAGWTDGLNAAWITSIVAIFTGLALARSRFSGSTAFLFATVYGLFVVGFFVGLSLPGDWHARALALIVRLNAFLRLARRHLARPAAVPHHHQRHLLVYGHPQRLVGVPARRGVGGR